ncbi:MAG: TetR/AcrR family transcriptional regulator [Actinomycetota bacterium]|nr:TetR/AcrR family transcriptional regulator [Actinomycetota bacterium]
MAVKRERSTYRQEQAAATKDRIAIAARKLFRERGYGATSIAAIAEEAGVAEPTVYAVFGSKKSFLLALRQQMHAEVELPELTAQAKAAPEANGKLEGWAKLLRRQMERSYDVIAAHREAARVDPAAAEEYRTVLESRASVMQEFVAELASDLAPGLDLHSATDVLWALSNEEIYRELVHERGWAPSRYEAWMVQTLKQQLLGQ